MRVGNHGGLWAPPLLASSFHLFVVEDGVLQPRRLMRGCHLFGRFLQILSLGNGRAIREGSIAILMAMVGRDSSAEAPFAAYRGSASPKSGGSVPMPSSPYPYCAYPTSSSAYRPNKLIRHLPQRLA